MASLAGRFPIVQVHPTRRCNLRCAHCYTSSGPKEVGELPVEQLAGMLADASILGYRQLAVSGGEPFMYSSLGRLLAAARGEGMRTTVTTNGMLLTPARLEAIVPHLDALAVSVDGPPADHNRMRRQNGAFEHMQRHLGDLRATGLPFGFIFTLTRYNADQLGWLVQMAEDQGASTVQIHPLAQVGRARSLLRGSEPDGLELLAAAVEVERLRARHPGIILQLDAAPKATICANRDVLVVGADEDLAKLAPVLIVDDAGEVIPLAHDIDPSYRLGSLERGSLSDLARSWRVSTARRFSDLLSSAYEAVTHDPEAAATDWYAAVAEVSRRKPENPIRRDEATFVRL